MDAKLRISGIINDSIVDGPGLRLVVFTQGCPHGCAGCHNPNTHDFAGGKEMTCEEIVKQLDENPLQSGVTLSGGEPFCQAEALLPLARAAKERGKHLLAYSGYTFEELTAMRSPAVDELLRLCDLLIDGRFRQEEKKLSLRFRGSSNQRIIDLAETRQQGAVVLSEYHNKARPL